MKWGCTSGGVYVPCIYTRAKWNEAVPLVEFMYPVFTHVLGESYRRRRKSLLLYLCYVYRALINSLVFWFCFVVVVVVVVRLWETKMYQSINFIWSQCINSWLPQTFFRRRQNQHCSSIGKSDVCCFSAKSTDCTDLAQHSFKMLRKIPESKNTYDTLWLFLWRHARETQKQMTIYLPQAKMVWILWG